MAIIGREPPADILIRAPQVSARHAEIVHLGGDEYSLRDLGSTNGTWVNGKRIESATVRPGDDIGLGDHPFILADWEQQLHSATSDSPAVPHAAPWGGPPPLDTPRVDRYQTVPAPEWSHQAEAFDAAGKSVAPYLFVPRVLRVVENGRTFREVFAIALRVIAVLVGVGALVAWIMLWTLVRALGTESASALIGLLVFQVAFAVGIYAIVHTILIRAGDIRRLPEGQFVVLPIVSVCFRLIGECLAWFFATMSIGGALLAFLAGSASNLVAGETSMGRFMPSGAGAGAALFGAITGLLIAFGALFLCYFLDEATCVLVAIAQNTEAMRKAMERKEGALT